MQKVIQIKALDEKEALKKAVVQFSRLVSGDVDKDELSVKLIKKKKGFLGFGKKENTYQVELKKEDLFDRRDKRALEMTDDISIDGDFDLKIVDEGVFIKVLSPEGDGDPVQYQHIKQELENREIVEVDWQIVQETVQAGEEEWGKIAPRKPELDRDGEADVKIDEDKLKAYLSYFPALGGKRLTVSDLLRTLEEAGVTYGIKNEKLKKIIELREKQVELLIAEGKKPVPGRDGEIIYKFEQKKNSIGTKRENGSIDFYDLGLITNVKEGDVLAILREPEPGQPGRAVTGEEIPFDPPVKKQLPTGKNVVKKDEKTLVAETAGQVVKDGKKISVLPVHQIDGNVDLTTGNIDFVGNVRVKGNVLEGFEIKAGGNVEVRGNVSAARIKSGGDVVIYKGFIGKDKGVIEARGDVKVKFVENGIIKSKESIYVSDAIMHSKLSAGDKIEVTRNKGLIVGGTCRAAKEITANIIGSNLATSTCLEAGINPELKKRMSELEDEQDDAKNNLLKARKALNILEKMKKKTNLPADKQKMYYKLLKTTKRLEQQISQNEMEYDDLQKKANNLTQGRVKVNNKIFPGVKLIIGGCQFNVNNELRHSTFVEDKGEIRQIPL